MMNANKWKSIERLGGKNETEFIFERFYLGGYRGD